MYLTIYYLQINVSLIISFKLIENNILFRGLKIKVMQKEIE